VAFGAGKGVDILIIEPALVTGHLLIGPDRLGDIGRYNRSDVMLLRVRSNDMLFHGSTSFVDCVQFKESVALLFFFKISGLSSFDENLGCSPATALQRARAICYNKGQYAGGAIDGVCYGNDLPTGNLL
jgi:hypothetical protein